MLDDIVNKYNNTVHRTINIKLIDVTSDFHDEYNKESNKNKPRFKAVGRIRISKYKKYFC